MVINCEYDYGRLTAINYPDHLGRRQVCTTMERGIMNRGLVCG